MMTKKTAITTACTVFLTLLVGSAYTFGADTVKAVLQAPEVASKAVESVQTLTEALEEDRKEEKEYRNEQREYQKEQREHNKALQEILMNQEKRISYIEGRIDG